MRKVHHPNAVQFLGACTRQEPYVLVTELMTGGSLSDAMRLQKSFTLRRAMEICIDTARGLAYMHNKKPAAIIHRDLKPGNLMISGSQYHTMYVLSVCITLSWASCHSRCSACCIDLCGYSLLQYSCDSMLLTDTCVSGQAYCCFDVSATIIRTGTTIGIAGCWGACSPRPCCSRQLSCMVDRPFACVLPLTLMHITAAYACALCCIILSCWHLSSC